LRAKAMRWSLDFVSEYVGAIRCRGSGLFTNHEGRKFPACWQ